jgi:hypothetical protein
VPVLVCRSLVGRPVLLTDRPFPRAILLDFYGTVVHEDDVPIGEICEQIAAASSMAVTAREIRTYWGQSFHERLVQSYGPAFRLQKDLELDSLRDVLQHFGVALEPRSLSQTPAGDSPRSGKKARTRSPSAVYRSALCPTPTTQNCALRCCTAGSTLTTL